jgi:hypothetical protein
MSVSPQDDVEPVIRRSLISIDDHSRVRGESLSRFFAGFINPLRRPETVTGYLEEIPVLYMKASKKYPVLQYVLRAVSLVHYGIYQKSEPIIARGRLAYDEVLRILSELISDTNDKIAVDELTVSVLLCGFYEVR